MSDYVLSLVFLVPVVCLVPCQAQEAKAPDKDAQTITLSVAEMKRQIVSCKPHEISHGLLPKGTVVPVRVTVDTKGKVVSVGFGYEKRCPIGCGLLAEPVISVRKCKFAPLTVDGHHVNYSGIVELVAP